MVFTFSLAINGNELEKEELQLDEKILMLADIKSRKEYESEIKSFFKESKARTKLILADANQISAQTINLCRCIIDSERTTYKKKVRRQVESSVSSHNNEYSDQEVIFQKNVIFAIKITKQSLRSSSQLSHQGVIESSLAFS